MGEIVDLSLELELSQNYDSFQKFMNSVIEKNILIYEQFYTLELPVPKSPFVKKSRYSGKVGNILGARYVIGHLSDYNSIGESEVVVIDGKIGQFKFDKNSSYIIDPRENTKTFLCDLVYQNDIKKEEPDKRIMLITSDKRYIEKYELGYDFRLSPYFDKKLIINTK